MRSLNKLLIVCGFVLSTISFAHAASIAEQIVTAIAGNDFNRVQTLVKNNPNTTGQAENSLITSAHGNLESMPQNAAKAMSTASTLAPGITPPDAKAVAENVRNLVKTIADKALLNCNPEANDNTGQLQTSESSKKIADQKAIASILDYAEEIAKTPAIVAVEPQLFADIAAMRAQCEEALLAQLPGQQPQNLPPGLIPTPIPPPSPPPIPASPD